MEFYNKLDVQQGDSIEPKMETYNLQSILLINQKNQFEIKHRFNEREMKESIKLQNQNGLVAQSQNFFSAFLGILTILDQKFLLMVQNVSKVVTINNNDIFKIESLSFIPFEFDAQQANKNIMIYESIEEIRKLFNLGFYFSYTYDLTNSYNNLKNSTQENFLWNNNMFQDLIKMNVPIGWRVPLIQGFVKGFYEYLNGQQIQLIIISRRSCKNAGTRYNSRGLDDYGNVANFCETEQIFIHNNYICSHVEIRGSVPIFWEQVGIKTSTRITRDFLTNKQVFLQHYSNLKQHYQNIISVNLMAYHKHGEQMITAEYEKVVQNSNISHYKYEYFDFHHMCKNEQFENVNPLVQKLKHHLYNFGFYFEDLKKKQVLLQQKGVFRTNCLDCLDRTNFLIAKLSATSLQQQMQMLGINFQENFGSENILQQLDMNTSQCHPFFQKYKELWADNGDFISRHYTGTGSTHTNITRTGKRDFIGLIDHGIKSLGRFYIQNFEDSQKQIGIDIILGEHSETIEHTQQNLDNFANFQEQQVFLVTWNMNQFLPPKEFNLKDKLFDFMDNDLPEIIIIGLQEIGNQQNSLEHWQTLIQDNLDGFQQEYINVHKNQDNQLVILVFAQEKIRKSITNIKYDWVKFYYVSNRGAQIFRLQIDDCDISFINADLEPSSFQLREQGLNEILNNAFQIASVGKRKYLKISCCDFIFLFGQLNLEINMKPELLSDLIQQLYKYQHYLQEENIQQTIEELQQTDDLQIQENIGVFKQFSEDLIQFAPTSIFEKFSTLYEKNKIGWKERIMISSKKNNWTQVFYDSKEFIDSTHRPVRALYKIQCRNIDRTRKLSSSFTEIINQQNDSQKNFQVIQTEIINQSDDSQTD